MLEKRRSVQHVQKNRADSRFFVDQYSYFLAFIKNVESIISLTLKSWNYLVKKHSENDSEGANALSKIGRNADIWTDLLLTRKYNS